MITDKKIIAVAAMVLLPALCCEAAWMRMEKELSASAGISLSDIGGNFDRSGARYRNTCGASYDVPIVVEYGYSYYHTLFASTSVSSFSCGAGQKTGLTDVELGVRGRVDLFRNDHIWEVATIIPNYVDPAGGARLPKNYGIRLGLVSSNRINPYQSFMAGDEFSMLGQPDVISYGVGLLTWAGHIPNEVSAYAGWVHTITDTSWSNNKGGGWYLSAFLDGTNSLGKTHMTVAAAVPPARPQRDVHDSYSLIRGYIGLSHPLTQYSTFSISAKQGLWGKNTSSPSGIHFGYSHSWQD